MNNLIDLHVHTSASDGVLTPAELVANAKKEGIKALGICDHDTVSGLDEAVTVGNSEGIEVIPGIELSTLHGSLDLHILGYFIDYHNEAFLKELEYLAEKRTERALKIVRKLQDIGFFLDEKALQKKSVNTTIGKPHIVLALLDEEKNKSRLKKEFGDCITVGNVIHAYLNYGKPAYVPKVKLAVADAITNIHKIGGLAVLAHPGFDIEMTRDGEAIIESFLPLGLDGVEVMSYIETDDKTKHCLAFFSDIADRFQLLKTGGSDYHGYKNCAAAEIGVEMGFVGTPFSVPNEYLSALRKRHEEFCQEQS